MKEAEPVFFNAEWGELTTDLRRSFSQMATENL